MSQSQVVDRFMEELLQGRRGPCRQILSEAVQQGCNAETIYFDVLWPAMEQVNRLYRQDRINLAIEHLATRINRMLTDQFQKDLPRRPLIGKKIVITCADHEPEELGAQMCTDLFETNGWDVYFMGGGVPHDEILEIIGQLRPDILLLYGTTPQGVPGVRQLIDLIRNVGANPTMNILVSGGVFNRADELWKEIHADLFAPTVQEALQMAIEAPPRQPEIRIPGAPKKRRRRRRPPLLLELERQQVGAR